MSEIKKLYENAEVKKQIPKVCSSNELYCKECEAHIEDAMPYCKNADYPPFTAEKQLELIKWLIQNKRLCVRKAEYSNNFYMDTIVNRLNGVDSKSFEVCLASLINNLWQDLTESEKKEIADILKV